MEHNRSSIHEYCFVADCKSKRLSKHPASDTTEEVHFIEFPDASTNYAVRQQWILFSARDDGGGGLLEPRWQQVQSTL